LVLTIGFARPINEFLQIVGAPTEVKECFFSFFFLRSLSGPFHLLFVACSPFVRDDGYPALSMLYNSWPAVFIMDVMSMSRWKSLYNSFLFEKERLG